MLVLTDSNSINFEVCHRVLSQSVYALLSLIQAMLNMSTLTTNDQGIKVVLRTGWQCQPSPGWSLSSSSSLVWRSPFPVTLQRIFNTRLKKLSFVVFCCYSWTLQQKPHNYICSGCKNMVYQKCAVFIGPPCTFQIPQSMHLVMLMGLEFPGSWNFPILNVTVLYWCTQLRQCEFLYTKQNWGLWVIF